MTRIQEVLARNLKHFRKIKGMTQETLAEKAGTSTNYIGTIEIGKKYPSPQMLEKLSEVLEIDSLDLFREEAPEKDFETDSQKALEKKQSINIEVLKNQIEKNISEALNKSFIDIERFKI